jgi:hypothetical protein
VASFLLTRRERSEPVPVYPRLTLTQSICFSLFFTLHLVYHLAVLGLDPFQMVMVGTVLEAA